LVEVITASALAGLPHGFLGRRGGASTGIVAGLNVGLGAGDDPQTVASNRARAADAVLPGARLVTVYQVHSPDCVTAGEWPETERPPADALVSATPGHLLGIVTADCAPVLLADRSAGIIGAAHAGWKGAVSGVVENTVAAMVALGARRDSIAAAIGPCIAQSSYEVDDSFRDRFLARDAGHARMFAPGRPGHWQFALEAFVADRLAAAGVATVEPLGLDTYADETRFFSFRRATHRGEPAYGRQFSLIGLPAA
jgi:YfiH family protein